MVKSVEKHVPQEGERAQGFVIDVDSHIETNVKNEDGDDVPSGIRHEGGLEAGVRYWICEGK